MIQLIIENTPFADLLKTSAERHQHVCPRQIMGVRMGLYARRILGKDESSNAKDLFTFIETDGCTLDGVVASSGCSVGHRTMHIYDFGKIAATFVDQKTEQAVRISPHPKSRELFQKYAPDAPSRWHAYVFAYQLAPEEELFVAQPVQLTVSMAAIISRKTARAVCDCCGEEIFNDREVVVKDKVLCQNCAGQSYYVVLEPAYAAAMV